jgi:hypothetical protein
VKCKKLASLGFLGVKMVVYLSSNYPIVHDPQIIAEICSVYKEYQVTKDETPEDKEKVSKCQWLEISSGAGKTGLVGFEHQPGQISAAQSGIGCSQEIRSNIAQIKYLHFSCMINKVPSIMFYRNPNLVIFFQLLHLSVIFLLVVLRE